MATYNTSEFRKGLKVQFDGDPYLMIECNFVKPGKGQALYKCKLRNLLRGTVLDRTYKSGDSLEAADIEEIQAQFLYRQRDQFFFMDNQTFEQYELGKEQVDDAWKYLKEGMICSMMLFNNRPDQRHAPQPRGAEGRVLRAGRAWQHGHQRDQAGQGGNRCRAPVPDLRRERRADQDRHPHRRVHRAGQGVGRAGWQGGPDECDPSRTFRPTANWDRLRLRCASCCARLREFFDRHGILEVETPMLSADTVVDRHLDPFAVPVGPAPAAAALWLQTSPEFAMKRLLAAAARRSTRSRAPSARRSTARCTTPSSRWSSGTGGATGWTKGCGLLSDLCDELLGRGPAERLSYAEAFRRHVGLDPHAASTADLAAAAPAWLSPPESLAADDRDGWLDLLLAERVQPHLGASGRRSSTTIRPARRPWPACGPGTRPWPSGSSCTSPGVELANGYHEIAGPGASCGGASAAANAQRRSDGKPPLPEQSRLLAAMEAGLPPATGVALGFDRVVMLAAGASSIREVMAFPFDRA